MAEQWYYRMFGQEFGPVPFSELQQLAATGSISSADEVRAERFVNWVSAGSVGELGLPADSPVSPSLAAMDHHHAAVGSGDWFCRFSGQEWGPLSFSEIVTFAEQGQLSADDEVKLGGDGKWRRVGSIGRLVAVLPFQSPENSVTATKKTVVATADTVVAMEKTVDETLAAQTSTPVPPTARGGVKEVKPSASVAHSTRPANSLPPVESPTSAVVKKPSSPNVETRPALVAMTRVESLSSVESPSASSALSTPPAINHPHSPTASRTRSATPPVASRPRPVTRPARPSSPFSLWEFLKGPAGIAGIVVVVVLLIVAWRNVPKSSAADIERHKNLRQILDDIRVARAAKSTDFSSIKKRAQKLHSEYVPVLELEASNDQSAKQRLLWATRDELPKMTSGNLAQESEHEKAFDLRLKEAAELLDIK